MNARVAPASTGLLTRRESAAYLAISERFLDEEIKAGRIAAVRIGRQVRITKTELDRYIGGLPAYEPAS